MILGCNIGFPEYCWLTLAPVFADSEFGYLQGGFFDWFALKMTKYKEKLKYLNWSANCSSQKVLSVKPQ